VLYRRGGGKTLLSKSHLIDMMALFDEDKDIVNPQVTSHLTITSPSPRHHLAITSPSPLISPSLYRRPVVMTP